MPGHVLYPFRTHSVRGPQMQQGVGRRKHEQTPCKPRTPRPGFEPGAYSLGGSRSIQLSYRGRWGRLRRWCGEADPSAAGPKLAAVYLAILVRRLREGKGYEDFVKAWYPDKGFGFASGRGPFVATSVSDDRELVTVGLFELDPSEGIEAAMKRVAEQESVRHERIDEVIESTSLRGLYELDEEFDFTDDASVAAGKPGYVERD